MISAINFDLSTCFTKSANWVCNSIGGTINSFSSNFDFDNIPFKDIFISETKYVFDSFNNIYKNKISYLSELIALIC